MQRPGSDLPIIAPPPSYQGPGEVRGGVKGGKPSDAGPPRRKRTQVEKYGAAYWLGLLGLFVVVGWVGWFAWGAWQLRDIWERVHVVNDASAGEEARVDAAWLLARDDRVTQRQRYDLALSLVPPEPARYLLAEGLTYEAVTGDPRGYALAVAWSEHCVPR